MLEADLHTLVELAVAGDEDGWRRLWRAVEPRLYAVLRRPYFLGRLSDSEDDCRNVIVDVMGRLRADDHARLRAFLGARDKNPGLPFVPWLLVVAKRVGIDYMRGRDGYIDRRHEKGASRPGKWQTFETLVGDSRAHGFRPPATDRATANEILELAHGDLPEPQVAALRAWLIGSGFAEIAAELELGDAREAERMVRAAIERLRRRFREEEPA